MSFYYLAYILIFSIITKDSSVSSTPNDQSINIEIKAEIEDKKEPLIQLVDRLNLVLENLKIDLQHDAKKKHTKVTKGEVVDGKMSDEKAERIYLEQDRNMNSTSKSTVTHSTTTTSTTITKKPKNNRTKKPITTSTSDTTTKKKKKLPTTPTALGNIFRTTAVNRKVTPKKVPPEKNGPFTTFVLEVMNHFVRVEYEEAYAYAWVFNKQVSYYYMYNQTQVGKLGKEFVRLVKGAAKYATTVSPEYLQKAIAYVRKFMVRRRQAFTKGFNEVLDYVDAIMSKSDKNNLDSLLVDLRDHEMKREVFINNFIYKVVTTPLLRLPDYEVEFLQKRITHEIKSTIFNGAFDAYAREGEGMPEDDGKYKDNDYVVEEESKDDSFVIDGQKQFVPPDEKKSIFSGFGSILDNVANLF